MVTGTREKVAERRVAPVDRHECGWCRAVDVEVVAVPGTVVSAARCRACGREGPLVPLGRAC